MPLAFIQDCIGQSDLLNHPKDWFSLVTAHFYLGILNTRNVTILLLSDNPELLAKLSSHENFS